MLTYRIRPRTFRHDPGHELTFPANCLIRFHLLPLQPFGMEPGGGHTTVQRKPARALFNANSGEHWIESAEPLEPLDVAITSPDSTVTLKGNVVEVREEIASLTDLEATLEGFYYVLPMLLNVDFADPPIVDRVDGSVAGVPFTWELRDWNLEFDVTTQERQEQRFAHAFDRIPLVAGLENRRLLAALHYFHVAIRLARVGATPGKFMAEAILNFAKTLEVLFPPSGDGHSRDAARAGLAALGFDDTTIERDYLPAMALRNEIDVGHVDLSLFSRARLKSIHGYTERAEQAFRELLQRVLDGAKSGTWSPAPYESKPPSSTVRAVLERLAAAEEQ